MFLVWSQCLTLYCLLKDNQTEMVTNHYNVWCLTTVCLARYFFLLKCSFYQHVPSFFISVHPLKISLMTRVNTVKLTEKCYIRNITIRTRPSSRYDKSIKYQWKIKKETVTFIYLPICYTTSCCLLQVKSYTSSNLT